VTIQIKRILGWASFGIGLLILTFFRKYTGHIIPYPWVFYSAGLIFFLAGFIFLRKIPTVTASKILEKANALIKDLRDNGNKVTVDLNLCEIKVNHYTEQPDNFKSATDLELFTAMDLVYFYNKIHNPTPNGQIYQSVAVYKTSYNGKPKTFYSPTIPLDKDNLLFKFGIQKTTTIYVDKNDSNKYYFDIGFFKNNYS
jgi:hypothetical protein